MNKSRFENQLGKVIARKYTVMMNNEPLDLYIKGDKVKSATFMGKKIKLDLDETAIAAIKDNPSRLVNGNNLLNNEEFTRKTSKMMSSHLHLAIKKRDLKTLSRFARSELVPEADKAAFIDAINRPRGLRRVLNAAVQKTNMLIQNLSKKIDRYFDKVQDKLVNKKLDKYLEEYQLKEFNKAPPLKDLDLSQNIDAKLRDRARDFIKNNHGFDKGVKNSLNGEIFIYPFLQEKFYKEATAAGFSPADAKHALAKELKEQDIFQNYPKLDKDLELACKQMMDLEKEKQVLLAELGRTKNNNLEDFEAIAKAHNLNQEQKIDLLVENKEYQTMDEYRKKDYENRHIFTMENIVERGVEVKAIEKVMQTTNKSELETKTPNYERKSTINFSDKKVQEGIQNNWFAAQKEARSPNPTPQIDRNFAHISAVKYNGISQQRLDKWASFAANNGKVSQEVADKFIKTQLSIAKGLSSAGILKEIAPGEYKFKDNFAKQTLSENYKSSHNELANLNKGVEVSSTSLKEELFDRVKQISSEKSFENLLNNSGEIQPDKLKEYASTLEAISIQMRNKANNIEITADDLKPSKFQENEHQRERA